MVLQVPLEIEGYDTASLDVELLFQTQIPGVFTAHLDFGADGQGPVLVMP